MCGDCRSWFYTLYKYYEWRWRRNHDPRYVSSKSASEVMSTAHSLDVSQLASAENGMGYAEPKTIGYTTVATAPKLGNLPTSGLDAIKALTPAANGLLSLLGAAGDAFYDLASGAAGSLTSGAVSNAAGLFTNAIEGKSIPAACFPYVSTSPHN